MKHTKLGIGTCSLIFSIISIIFSFSYTSSDEARPIGAIILNFFGIYKMTGITSLLLFIFSIFLGIKYKEDFGARLGVILSTLNILLMIILVIVNFLSNGIH